MPPRKKPAAAPDPAAGAAAARPRRTRRRSIAPASTGLSPAEVTAEDPPPALAALGAAIEKDGGTVAAAYREPLGGRWMLLAALPVERVEPTPYQRDLSPAHVKRLADVLSRCGRFLDPLIVVREPDGRYHTPNGHHRLAAMRFRKGAALGFEECLDRMEAAAARFDPDQVRPQDLARAAGPPETAE